MPKSNKEFWREKLNRNVKRDRSNLEALISSGWRVAIVWECTIEHKGTQYAAGRIADWLTTERRFMEI